LADILAGIEWAAGLSVPGAPANPNPAHIINLSLGSGGACNAAYQDTINRVTAAGKIIVAATGNEGGPVGQPANCAGVIAVTAHAANGDNADYANVGPQVHISAPGGGCGYQSATNSAYQSGEQGWTVLNCASCHSLSSLRSQITARAPSGLTRSKALSALNAALTGADLDGMVTGMGTFAALSTAQRSALADYISNYPACLGPSDEVLSTVNTSSQAPGAEGYGGKQGTSMATPHVSGVASLMLALSPKLYPNEVRSILQSTARPHPANTTCFGVLGQCGTGLLDAASAVARVRSNLPTVSVGSAQVVRPGTVVRLTATATGPRPLSYQWRQTSGPQVGLATPLAMSASFPAAVSGTLGFEFVAFDAMGGYEARATTTVQVNSPPVMNPITPMTTTVGSTITGRVSATDADGDRILYAGTSVPSGMVINPDTGEYTWTPTSPGDSTLIVVAADALGNGAPATARFIAQGAVTPGTPGSTSSSAVTPSGGGGATGAMLIAVLCILSVVAGAVRGRPAGDPSAEGYERRPSAGRLQTV
jgi:cytochrome c553